MVFPWLGYALKCALSTRHDSWNYGLCHMSHVTKYLTSIHPFKSCTQVITSSDDPECGHMAEVKTYRLKP